MTLEECQLHSLGILGSVVVYLCTDAHHCYCSGDFHFLWECLKVLLNVFWGSPSHVGSLCNIRELVRRVQVDKKGKVFNVCDEFCCTRTRATSLLPSAHSFTLTLQMMLLHMNRPCSGWRQQQILSYRKPFTDTVYGLRSFLHSLFVC